MKQLKGRVRNGPAFFMNFNCKSTIVLIQPGQKLVGVIRFDHGSGSVYFCQMCKCVGRPLSPRYFSHIQTE